MRDTQGRMSSAAELKAGYSAGYSGSVNELGSGLVSGMGSGLGLGIGTRFMLWLVSGLEVWTSTQTQIQSPLTQTQTQTILVCLHPKWTCALSGSGGTRPPQVVPPMNVIRKSDVGHIRSYYRTYSVRLWSYSCGHIYIAHSGGPLIPNTRNLGQNCQL